MRLVTVHAPRSLERTASALRKLRRHATLLVAELLFILVYPFFIDFHAHEELFRLLAVMVFCAALYAVLGKGRVTRIAFALGLPAIVIHLFTAAGRVPFLLVVSLTMSLVFLIFITSVFVWSIVSDPTVTTDTLAGAIAAYLLIGITFGMLYSLVERLLPGSFRDTIEAGKHLSQSEFVFFSFVTLTTVGYGDIVPWSAHARSVVIIESVLGIMYPAVLISRLVGMHHSTRESSSHE